MNQGRRHALMTARATHRELVGERDHAREVCGGEHLGQHGTHRRHLQRAAGQGAAESQVRALPHAGPNRFARRLCPEAPRDRRAHPIEPDRHPSADGLADDEEVGVQVVASGVAAGTCAQAEVHVLEAVHAPQVRTARAAYSGKPPGQRRIQCIGAPCR
jgi:hypothetical protein